jgi:uncharacterized surface protein with fasciclin (FAS1) repeats
MKSSNRVNLISKFGNFLAIAGFSSALMLPATVGATPVKQPSGQPVSPTSAQPITQSNQGSKATSISCEAASTAPGAVPATLQTVPGNAVPGTTTPDTPAPGNPLPGNSVPAPNTKGAADKPAGKPSVQQVQAPPSSTEMPSTPQPTSVDTLDKPAAAPASTSSAKKDNLIARAEAKGSFKTLMAALQAADLTQTLACKGPYTVFAPTDEAFAALPKGTLEKLLKPENKAVLVKLLTYHVVSGEVLAKALKAGNQVTVEGNPVTVKLNGKQVMINNARVVQSDVVASNGVIHAIDKVIVPPDLQ